MTEGVLVSAHTFLDLADDCRDSAFPGFAWVSAVAFQSSQRITDASCFSVHRVGSGGKFLYSWSHPCDLPFSGFLSQT